MIRSRVRTLSACLLLAASGAAVPAAGQTAPDTLDADPADLPLTVLDPLVVTVSKMAVRADRAGFSVSVLPAEALEAEHPVYAAEALRELPGAFIDEAVGPGGPTIVRLRGGEEVFTQILMDGVQVNENGGFFDFQGVTLGNLERMEVARGPQSALYGSSAVSGVVHLVTRPGRSGSPRLSGTLEGGGGTENGRRFRGLAEVRGGSESLLYSASAGVAYNRGIYELPHDTWSRDASVRLDATPAARWRVTGVGRFIGVESNHPVRDAGVTRVPLDPNARLERDRWVGSVEAAFDASARWTHRLRGTLFRQDFTFLDRRDDIAPPEGVFVTDATFDFGADLWRTGAEYVGRWSSSPGTSALDVAFGGQWEREDLANTLAGDFGDSEEELDRQSVAGFVDLHATPHPSLSLLAGARVERWEGLSAEATPRASAAWEAIPSRLSLRAAAGRAYKVPNLQEQFTDNAFLKANPDIEPETSVSWEVGADLEAGPAFTLGVTGFRQSYRNLIRTVPLEGEDRFQNRNVGRSRAWGVEGSLRWRAAPTLSWGVDATRTWTEVVDNTGLPPDQYPVGRELPFRPSHLVSVLSRIRPADRVEVLLRATRVGSQVVLSERFSGRRVELDPYTRLDATLDVLLDARRTLFLRVDNLLDADYQTAFDRPGLPPTAVVGVRFR